MKTGLSNVGGEARGEEGGRQAGKSGGRGGGGGWECGDLPRIPIDGGNKTFSRGVITRV